MNRHTYETTRIGLYMAEVAACNRYLARPNPKRFLAWGKRIAERRAFLRDVPRPNDIPGDEFCENREDETFTWPLLESRLGVTP